MTNRELVQQFYDEVFNRWDLSRLDDFMLDTYRQHNPEVKDGKAGFREFMAKFLAMRPYVEISKIICEDDMVVVFFKCTMGKTGSENKVFDMYRIENGKLAEHWDCVMNIDGIVSLNGRGQF